MQGCNKCINPSLRFKEKVHFTHLFYADSLVFCEPREDFYLHVIRLIFEGVSCSVSIIPKSVFYWVNDVWSILEMLVYWGASVGSFPNNNLGFLGNAFWKIKVPIWLHADDLCYLSKDVFWIDSSTRNMYLQHARLQSSYAWSKYLHSTSVLNLVATYLCSASIDMGLRTICYNF